MAERKSSPRSEKIRAKRKTTPKRKTRSAPGLSQNMPPVLMRGGFASMAQPRRKKKGKHPKRRFDIALSSPGVEIRLPAIPAVRLGWRLVSAVLSIGLFALLYHFWTSPLYQVQIAEIDGNQYMQSDAVNQELNLYNKPIFQIDPQQVEADLERAYLGLLVDSSVQIIWPASVVVTVQERLPIISWEQGSETLWVDAEGISFEPAGENNELVRVSAADSPPAPIVYQDDPEQTEDIFDPEEEVLVPEAFMTPKMASAIIRTNEFKPGNTILNFDIQHGLGWHDEKHGWDIYFGIDVTNMEEKLAVYKAIKTQLKADGISPLLISVEHIHAPYYRLEQ